MHTDIVTVNHKNQVFVSSREVAAKFNKRHSNVIRDIQELHFSNKDKEEFMKFFSRNFEEQRISLNNSPRRGRPPEPHYLISRDGFVLLAMGFTGRKALEWKVKFLNAFNELEQTLQTKLPALQAENERLKLENAELREKPKALKGARADSIPAPVLQENLFGVVEAIRWELRRKETLDQQTQAKAQARHMRKMMKGLAAKYDALIERIDMMEGNKKAKLIRMIKDEPE